MKSLHKVTTYRDRDDGVGTEPQPTTFSSDGMGRPWKTSYPDGSYEETHLEFGQLKSWRSRKQVVKTIVRYDARENLKGSVRAYVQNIGRRATFVDQEQVLDD